MITEMTQRTLLHCLWVCAKLQLEKNTEKNVNFSRLSVFLCVSLKKKLFINKFVCHCGVSVKTLKMNTFLSQHLILLSDSLVRVRHLG